MNVAENKYLRTGAGGVVLCVQVIEEDPRSYGIVKFSPDSGLPIGKWSRKRFRSAESAQNWLEEEIAKGNFRGA